MQKPSVVIVGIARTPQGKLLGNLKDVSATELGAYAIETAIAKSKLAKADVDEVLMGCVLPAGLGQAPARQAALKAGLLPSTQCTTINKVCGSGMKSVMLAHDNILTGTSHICVAGGMESMSNAPYLALQGRQGYRLGHSDLFDHMLYDGLEDAYEKGRTMGSFADDFAKKNHFSRQDQDTYAQRSLTCALAAIAKQKFNAEITPITITTKNTTTIITRDEHPGSVKIEKIPSLPPAFTKDGTVTAANASAIADGAAALVLMSESNRISQGLPSLARIVGHASHAKKPAEFTSAPIDAIKKLLTKINWTIEQVDLFEINEAFAVVPLACMRDLHIPLEKLNVHGGGCALGHPIGATGARIIVTLISALQQYGLKRGIAALCIGGGEATAIAVEIV
jgi:acetyl-CoA C-acetyltransferase